MKKLAMMLLAAATLVGCNSKNNTQAVATPADANTRQASAVQQVPQAGQLSGKVLETMDAAGYTYLRLETSTGEQWAAVSAAKVEVGQTVAINEQMTTENFESKTLNRTFDRIVFGTIADPNAPAASAMGMPAGHPQTGADGGPAQHMSGPKDVVVEKLPKAEGPNGRTVAELWSAKKSLDNKPVVVRGKVVKFLGGIMGKNWVHVRDGSGSNDDGTNDLTVTTDEVVNVGDVVLVSGTLRADKDFGSGYAYGVIVEEGKFKTK